MVCRCPLRQGVRFCQSSSVPLRLKPSANPACMVTVRNQFVVCNSLVCGKLSQAIKPIVYRIYCSGIACAECCLCGQSDRSGMSATPIRGAPVRLCRARPGRHCGRFHRATPHLIGVDCDLWPNSVPLRRLSYCATKRSPDRR